MNIKLSNPKPPPSLEQINEVQLKLGLKFPEEYINFLLNFNGGRIMSENGYYTDMISLGCIALAKFYSVEGDFGIEEMYLTINDPDWEYKGYLPLAVDDLGSGVFISCNSSSYGEIFYWGEHEESLISVAPNLTYFLNNLKYARHI